MSLSSCQKFSTMKPKKHDPRQSAVATFRVQKRRCQSEDPKNAADLSPQADASVIRTSLVCAHAVKHLNTALVKELSLRWSLLCLFNELLSAACANNTRVSRSRTRVLRQSFLSDIICVFQRPPGLTLGIFNTVAADFNVASTCCDCCWQALNCEATC